MSDSDKQFTIQPAPSHPPQEGGGLNSGLQQGPAAIFHAKGPHIPQQDVLNKLDAPLSKEELQKRQEELNK
ncbi:hypothetical protein RhiJN_20901 [Ceratobasidium sp. AG-Ba]|nr:hypothetical protein RhiJN_06091 [Ceratobasidium sp. AG-Ba]QRV92883.1 hypothetical protein RhiJN_20901 [Ceratobasidium sp. AG-Ba]QRW07042.1 hypothetical protein RhiLY_06041 [Ceratobasidium sp. AG-Ba]